MEYDDLIAKIRSKIARKLDDLQKTIASDEDLDDKQRASLTETVEDLREKLNTGGPNEAKELRAMAALFDVETDGLEADSASGAGDELSALAGMFDDDVESDPEPAERPSQEGAWRDIRRIMVYEMELKNILYSDDDDDFITAQFGMGDGEGRKLVVRVIYTPDADCVQIRAGYPFDIDRRVLPIARMFICKRCYEMRYTRIEMDSRDGEVYVCTVLRSEDRQQAPEGFRGMLHLTMSVAFDEYDTLQRYARAEFTDEERAAFLEEVERISPLMLED